jgi:hypothetical protein
VTDINTVHFNSQTLQQPQTTNPTNIDSNCSRNCDAATDIPDVYLEIPGLTVLCQNVFTPSLEMMA